MNALQSAQFFLLTSRSPPTDEDARRLANLIEEFARQAFNNGLLTAIQVYRELHSGGCHVLSKGDACDCFLCRIDRKQAT
jgi:hypothetical protein